MEKIVVFQNEALWCARQENPPDLPDNHPPEDHKKDKNTPK